MKTKKSSMREQVTLFFCNTKRALIFSAGYMPKYLWAMGILSLVNSISGVVSMYYIASVIDGVFQSLSGGAASTARIFIALGFATSFQLFEQITFKLLSILERRAFLRSVGVLEEAFNKKMTTLDLAYFEDADFNALHSRIYSEVSYRPANFVYRIFTMVQAILRMVVPAIILVSFAPWMLPVVILSVLPSLIVDVRLSKINWGFWQEDGDANTLHWKILDQMRDQKNLFEVRIFGLSGYLSKRVRELMEIITKKQERAIKKSTAPMIISRVIEMGAGFGLDAWVLLQVIRQVPGFSIGSFSYFTAIISRFAGSVGLFSSLLSEMFEFNLYMTDYYKLMDLPPLLPVAKNRVTLRDKVPKIDIDNVSFSYPEAQKQSLINVSMTIEPGEKVAIVGENGAGKTTLIKLLMRFYDPTSGSISIENTDLKSLDLDSWYKNVGVLFQDFNRYPFDVSTNIQLGKIRAPIDEQTTEGAAKAADAHDMTIDLKHGYRTVLDKSFTYGIQPSGGQWQRIALARAFYRDANILILDEPTAAIDAKAEYKIFNNIFKRYKNKTAIIISHRFSTVRKADRIIVLKEGAIVEEGTHDELVAKDGLYNDMFEKQASGYR